MKKIFVLLSLCCSVAAFAQNDSVDLGANVNNMVFYNISSHTKTTSANDDWHLAFSVRPAIPPNTTNQAAAIRINETYGTKLYLSPTQKINSWSTFDTTGYTGWQQMHNPDTTWTIGAFNANKSFTDLYNYGWGEYNFSQHSVDGDSSIYLLQLPDGSFRKFAILNLDYDTAFNVQFAKLDNSDFTAQEVRKKPYLNKSFVYYNLITKTIADKEPLISDWDMVFLRWYNSTAYFNGTLPQDIGILTNDKNSSYAASGNDALQSCYSGTAYSNYINVIGKSWEGQPGDTVIPGLAYFIKTNTGAVHKMNITGFGSQANEVVNFTISQCTNATGISDISTNTMGLIAYPVPASDILNINMTSADDTKANIQLLDISGRVIQSQNADVHAGTNVYTVSTSSLQSGNYILSIATENGKTNRLISVVR